MSEQHLSRVELTRWRDEGAGDRAHIVGHLAGCAACRSLAAEIERQRPAEAEPLRFRAVDFVGRGYSVRHRSIAPLSRRWGWGAAAAALVALALIPLWLARGGDGEDVLRGNASPIRAVHPHDVTVSVETLSFEWTGAPADARVRLNVLSLDRPGEPIIEREVTGSRYEPTAAERSRFRSGESVRWYVELLGPRGGGPSPAARFSVR
jgi:hypothetical protein